MEVAIATKQMLAASMPEALASCQVCRIVARV